MNAIVDFETFLTSHPQLTCSVAVRVPKNGPDYRQILLHVRRSRLAGTGLRYEVSRRTYRGDFVTLPGDYFAPGVRALIEWVEENHLVVTRGRRTGEGYVPWEKPKGGIQRFLGRLRKSKLIVPGHMCTRCEGTGEEPGAAVNLEAGIALCAKCYGAGWVQ
jgi:hypothetical protein